MPLTVPPGLTSPLSADLDFNSHKGTNVSDPTNAQDASTKIYVDNAISAISQNTGSQVISGCGVAWSGTGLQFIVSAGTYSINGVSYSVGQTTVTLDAADGSNPRIDLIIATSSSTFDKITGTPAASPVAPSVDPATQLQLTFVYVAAGATTPGVTNTLLYDENVGAATEWNSSSSGATWSLGSTNNPYSGTKDIEATTVGTAAYAQLQKGSGTLDPSTQNSLVFYIRSKASWANNRSLTISLLNAGTQQGNAISLRDGVYGFSSATTSSYQQIVIPITAFAVGSSAINQLRFTVAGSGGTIGFYLDLITFQAGVNTANQNFIVNRGAWVSTNAYVKNDLVTDSNRPWVALIANTNSRPSDSNTNWQSANDPADQRTLATNRVIPANSSEVFVDKLQLPAGVSMTIPSTSAILIHAPSNSSSIRLAYWDAIYQVIPDFMTTSTTLVNIPGLSHSADANSFYEIEALLRVQGTDTAGIKNGWNYSAAGSSGKWMFAGSNTGSGANIGVDMLVATATSSIRCDQANVDNFVFVKGIVKTGANTGNITIQVLKVTSGTATVYTGSIMKVRKILS